MHPVHSWRPQGRRPCRSSCATWLSDPSPTLVLVNTTDYAGARSAMGSPPRPPARAHIYPNPKSDYERCIEVLWQTAKRVSSKALFLRSAQEKWSAMYKGNLDRLGLLIADHQDKWNCSTGTDRKPVSRTSLKPSIFKEVPKMGQFGSLVLLPLLSVAFNIPIFETPKIATTLTHFYFETS